MSDEQVNLKGRFAGVVEKLAAPIEWQHDHFIEKGIKPPFPSRTRILESMEVLRSVLFPGYYGSRELNDENIGFHIGANLDRVVRILEREITLAISSVYGQQYEKKYASPGDEQSILDKFIDSLPEIRRKLVLDAQACYEWDPAVFIPEAPIFCYPNMRAMMNYRVAHELLIRGVPFIPRIITEEAHNVTGIDIHPGAEIGESFFIDHGTGVVIGQTTVIGDRVRLYQGVTLGVIRFPLDEATQRPQKGIPRHPIIEDDVTIYAESTVLGRITIGRGSVIGANVFLAKSIPPGSRVYASPVRVGHLKNKEEVEPEVKS